MFSFIIKRILTAIPLALGVIILVGLLVHVVPGDPVDQILGDYATYEEKQALRHELGLDQPIYRQVAHYVSQVVAFNFGYSLLSGKKVSALITERIQPTVELAIVSLITALLISVPLGILSALFAGSLIDYCAMFFALLGVSMPNFWLGSLLILLFSLEYDWLPVSGYGHWQNFVLPAITMGTALSAVTSRMMRNTMLDCMHEDYVRTARAKGLPEFKVIGKHVLRNALMPLVTIVGLQFGVLLTGAIITEVIFDWPGLGTLLLEAVQTRDYPVIQTLVLMFSMTYLVVNLLTDIAYGLVDPRVRLGSKAGYH